MRWSAVEMDSEHCRCAARNSLPVRRRGVDLGTVQVGERVAFVAVSAAAWDDPAVGLIRLERTRTVEGNVAPADFDTHAFEHLQREVRATARNTIETLGGIGTLWDRGRLDNSATRARMWTELGRIRSLLQQHPRFDGGWWWVLLGG